MPQKVYTVKLDNGKQYDVTTDGGPPSEDDVLKSLGHQSTAPLAQTNTPDPDLEAAKKTLSSAQQFTDSVNSSIKPTPTDKPYSFWGDVGSSLLDAAKGMGTGLLHGAEAQFGYPQDLQGDALQQSIQLNKQIEAAKTAPSPIEKAGRYAAIPFDLAGLPVTQTAEDIVAGHPGAALVHGALSLAGGVGLGKSLAEVPKIFDRPNIPPPTQDFSSVMHSPDMAMPDNKQFVEDFLWSHYGIGPDDTPQNIHSSTSRGYPDPNPKTSSGMPYDPNAPLTDDLSNFIRGKLDPTDFGDILVSKAGSRQAGEFLRPGTKGEKFTSDMYYKQNLDKFPNRSTSIANAFPEPDYVPVGDEAKYNTAKFGDKVLSADDPRAGVPSFGKSEGFGGSQPNPVFDKSDVPLFDRSEKGGIKIGQDIESAAKELTTGYSRNLPAIMVREAFQNAKDAVSHLGTDGKIGVKIDKQGFEISDNGKGMDRQELETVFSDLNRSGKRTEEGATGGKGIGKATYMLGGKDFTVTTVKDVKGRKIELTMSGTPQQFMKHVDVNGREVPPDTPTGTKIRTNFNDEQIGKDANYSAGVMMNDIENHSRDIQGQLKLDSDGLGYRDISYKPSSKDATIGHTNIDGNDISVGIDPKVRRGDTSYIATHVLNNGMYQYSKPLFLSEKIPDMPSDIVINVKPSATEGTPDYPFPTQRESLKSTVEEKLRKYVEEVLINPSKATRANKLKQLYESMPEFKVGTNRPGVLFDPGNRLKPNELEYFRKSPLIKNLIQTYDAAVSEALGPFSNPEWSKKLEKIGMVLDPNIHGVHIPNPTSTEPKSTILINPFEHIIASQTPDNAARKTVSTLLHEIAHIGEEDSPTRKINDSEMNDPRNGEFFSQYLNQVGKSGTEGHGTAWLKRLGKVFADYGPEQYFNTANRITQLISDEHGGYNADIQKLLQIYKNRSGREETTPDYLSGTGVKSDITTGGKGDTSSNVKTDEPGATDYSRYLDSYFGNRKNTPPPPRLADVTEDGGPRKNPNVIYTPKSSFLSALANLSSKTTRMVMGFHIPGTALSFHGLNEAVRNTLFGPNLNPFATLGRAVDAVNYLANPRAANRYLKVNDVELQQAIKEGGLKIATGDIGFKNLLAGNNILSKGINYLTDPKPLFEQVIPALKLKSYQGLVNSYVSKGIPEMQAKKLAGTATNNIYGGLNLQELMRNPTTQELFRTVALAPDWLETNFRIGAGMVTKPGSIENRVYQVGALNFLGSYIAANVLNATINNGKFMYQNPTGHEFDIAMGVDSKGRTRYLSPYGTSMDMLRIPLAITHAAISDGNVGHAFEMLRSRMSEPAQFGTDLLTNTDFAGRTLYGKSKYGKPQDFGKQFGNIGLDAASHMLPIGAEGMVQYGQGQISGEEALAKGLQLPIQYKRTR